MIILSHNFVQQFNYFFLFITRQASFRQVVLFWDDIYNFVVVLFFFFFTNMMQYI